MDDRAHMDPAETDLPLGTHPLAFLAVLAGVVALTYVSANFLFQQVGASTFEAGPELVDVPPLAGTQQERAVEQLEALGFDVTIEEKQNVTAPVGEVVGQRPRPGHRIEPGSTVVIVVSAGDGFVRVPDVRGSPLHEIQLLLFSHGFAMGDVGYEEHDAAPDEVIGQLPAPGETVRVGTPLHVVVSSGPPTIELPDLTDMDALEAGRLLRELGFGVIYEDKHSWSVERGAVIDVDPDEEAVRGTYIVLSVSLGRPASRPTAPAPPPPPSSTEPPQPTTPSTTTAPPEPTPSTTPDGVQTYAPYEH